MYCFGVFRCMLLKKQGQARPLQTAFHREVFMLDSIQAPLDAFPEGVVQLQDGVVVSANAMARHYLPQLEAGRPCPEFLTLPRESPVGAGTFTAGPAVFTYSCTATREGQVVLFRPAPQTALTDRQLEGVLYQLRTLLGEVLAEVGPATAAPGIQVPADAFSKSFHRLFRLVGNLEYMQQAAGEEGVLFHPVTMDLDGLCRHVVQQAYPLLKEVGVELEYEPAQNGLLIPGDPELLQQLLLELISNAARAAGEGRVTLALRRQGERALLSVSNNGPLPNTQQIAALFQQGGGTDLPQPGQGAGLGLPIARHIVTLHKGALLVEWGRSAPSVVLSLPTGPLDGRLSVHTPTLQRDGGLDPVLTRLSDLLPPRLFGMEGLD